MRGLLLQAVAVDAVDVRLETISRPYGSFQKEGVPYVGVLMIRILLFMVLIRVPYFRKPPILARQRNAISKFASTFAAMCVRSERATLQDEPMGQDPRGTRDAGRVIFAEYPSGTLNPKT